MNTIAVSSDMGLQTDEKKMAECIVLLEEAIRRIEEETALTNERFATDEARFNQRIEKMHAVLAEFKEMMTQTGVARLRVTMESAAQEGKNHLAALQALSANFEQRAEATLIQLEETAQLITEQLIKATRGLQMDKLTVFADEEAKRLEDISCKIKQRLKRLSYWFSAERILSVVSVALLVAMSMGLFINGEMPWNSHQRVLAERQAGQMLLKAWPNLSDRERSEIESASSYV